MLIVNITNDDTGDVKIGNYDYKVLINKTVIAKGRIEAHERKGHWSTLIRKMLYNAYKGV
jgi:hypothetical protein